MLPFEFTIKGPPVSVQARRKIRLRQWQADVKSAAQRQLGATSSTTTIDVNFSVTYYYEGSSPDVDNIIKPIQDALIGVIYEDDAQVVETKSRKRSIDGSYQIRGASSVLLAAFAESDAFLHVIVCEAEESGVL